MAQIDRIVVAGEMGVDEALAEAATQCVDELTPEAGAAARCNTVLSDGEGLLVGEYIEGKDAFVRDCIARAKGNVI